MSSDMATPIAPPTQKLGMPEEHSLERLCIISMIAYFNVIV